MDDVCVITGMLHALIQFADTSAAQAAKLVCNICPLVLSGSYFDSKKVTIVVVRNNKIGLLCVKRGA